MGRSYHVLLCALAACEGPYDVLRASKAGIRNPDLVLSEDSLTRAMKSYDETQALVRRLGLPAAAGAATREAKTPLQQACATHSEHHDERDAAALPASEGCVFSGRISQDYQCDRNDQRVAYVWSYEDFRVRCGDEEPQDFSGHVALEVGENAGETTYFLAIDLGGRRSATYSQWHGKWHVAELVVLFDGAKRAVLSWQTSNNGPWRSFDCFMGRDKIGTFVGTYRPDKIALYVPETEKERAHYRVQAPEESVISEGCSPLLLDGLCWLTSACD